jgi:hypothetical protein
MVPEGNQWLEKNGTFFGMRVRFILVISTINNRNTQEREPIFIQSFYPFTSIDMANDALCSLTSK